MKLSLIALSAFIRFGLIATIVVFATGAFAFAANPSMAHPPTNIVASNWKFTPATVTVRRGAATTFHLTSSSGVHSIKSDELGIAATTISPGKFVDAKFTPKKAGTYKIACGTFCGPGHAGMVLTVIVK
jgi:cytochrome c oxidase subunit 2